MSQKEPGCPFPDNQGGSIEEEGLYELVLNFDTRPAIYTAHRENILPPTQTHYTTNQI